MILEFIWFWMKVSAAAALLCLIGGMIYGIVTKGDK
jgi:hypothetical protein